MKQAAAMAYGWFTGSNDATGLLCRGGPIDGVRVGLMTPAMLLCYADKCRNVWPGCSARSCFARYERQTDYYAYLGCHGTP